jgi:PAS domain-containing protein
VLVLLCLLPAVLALGLLATRYQQYQHSTLSEQSQQSARLLHSSIEGEVQQARQLLTALSIHPALQQDELAPIRAQAARLLLPGSPISQLLVQDRSGRPVLQLGTPLAAEISPEATLHRLRRCLPVPPARVRHRPAGPESAGGRSGRPRQRHRAVLSAIFHADWLGKTLRELQLAPNSMSAVTTPTATAGHRRRARLIWNQSSRSQPAQPAAPAPDGHHRHGRDQRAQQLSGRHQPSAAGALTTSRWPRRSTCQPRVLADLAALGTGTALVLLAVAALAGWCSIRLGRSMLALRDAAQALAAGQPYTLGSMGFLEAGQIAHAIQSLQGNLRRHQARLESQVAERTAQLEKNRSQLETLYATAPVGLSYVDAELRYVRLNEFLAALNRQPVVAHLGRHVADMIADADLRREVLADYRSVLETGQPAVNLPRSGHPETSPDQLRHWVISYYPQFGSDGRIVGITGLMLDVTEQKRIEAELRQSRQLLRSVVDNMPAMIFLKRLPDLRYEMFNRYGAQLYERADSDELMA